MIESIRHLFDLIFDRSKSWGFRTATTVSVIGLLLLADLIFGFTYNFQISNQINQLEQIQTLKECYKSEPEKLNKILTIERNILRKEHYSSYISRKFKDLLNAESLASDHKIEYEDEQVKNKRSLFWMVLTSNFFLALIFPFLLFIPLFSENGRKANALVGWFASIVLLSLLIAFITWISYQIPLIDNNAKWNYLLNFVIHLVFVAAMVKYSDKNKAQKTNANSI